MRFISWNVNGLRACMQKGFLDFFEKANADFFCLQETKLQEGQISLDLPGYEQYWCYAEKKGYSGTAIFTKHTPLSVSYGIGIPELDTEGRAITLEYEEFYLVTCYTPNAQRGLARIEHRMKWEDAFRAYLKELDSRKAVILCGDLNVAHKEIDLKNPSSNRGSAGFSDEEREAFSKLLESGFTDTFRHLHPNETGAYTWWSYMFNARQNNAGWRIDYFVVSDRLKDAIHATPIHADVMGSDHCPVELDLEISCNGSIWFSSEQPDGAPKKCREDKKEKGPSKVPSLLFKASAAVVVLVLVVCLGLFAWLKEDSEDFSDWFRVEVMDTGLTRVNTDDAFLTENSATGLIPYTDGTDTWYIQNGIFLLSSIQLEYSTLENSTWRIRLDLTTYGKLKFQQSDRFSLGASLVADIINTETSLAASSSYMSTLVGVTPWYTKDQKLGGYFLYGDHSTAGEIQVRLITYESASMIMSYIPTKTVCQTALPFEPIIYVELAQSMSTTELVESVLSIPELVEAATNGIEEDFQDAYIKAMEQYPALAELTGRSEAYTTIWQNTGFVQSYQPDPLPDRWIVARAILELPEDISGIEMFFGYVPNDDPVDATIDLPEDVTTGAIYEE